MEDHSESQWGVLACFCNTVDHNNSPDFFGGPVWLCPSPGDWGHSTLSRNRRFQGHLVCILGLRWKWHLPSSSPLLLVFPESEKNGGTVINLRCIRQQRKSLQIAVPPIPLFHPQPQAPCFFLQKTVQVEVGCSKVLLKGSLFSAVTFFGILSVGYPVWVFTL